MTRVTRILSQIEAGDPSASEQLLPLVYEELRKLAAARMAAESPGQTLQPTALVHEAYLRLVGPDRTPCWENRGHFFAAAAEAMRRILINRARDKQRLKRQAPGRRVDLDQISVAITTADEDLIVLDEALARLVDHDPQMAELVKLRFYAGCTQQQAADLLGLPRRTADRYWAYARAWLLTALQGGADPPSPPSKNC
jgi:RNA polymerase sigma factor (TIGR02999 family)